MSRCRLEHFVISRHKLWMRCRWSVALTLLFGLFSSGCDAGKSATYGLGEHGDPSAVGSNDDMGSEDGLKPTPVALNGHLKVVGPQLQNEDGEPVQLKGVSSMWLNWESAPYAEDLTGLRWLRNNWNLSVLRVAMGVEPGGAYLTNPDKAKQQLYKAVDNAIEAGVYVIVDFHAHRAVDEQDAAVAFFSEVSAKYSGVPNLIYETYNEPIQITWTDLKKYHEAVVAAIREQDAEAPIVLGTPNYSQEVTAAAADPVEGTNLLYTLHYYSCTHGASLRTKAESAVTQGLPIFVTEWGATNADGGLDGKLCLDEAQNWDDWTKSHLISWTAWKFEACDPDSSCILLPGAPTTGGWTDDLLHGHGPFVRGRMQQ